MQPTYFGQDYVLGAKIGHYMLLALNKDLHFEFDNFLGIDFLKIATNGKNAKKRICNSRS